MCVCVCVCVFRVELFKMKTPNITTVKIEAVELSKTINTRRINNIRK